MSYPGNYSAPQNYPPVTGHPPPANYQQQQYPQQQPYPPQQQQQYAPPPQQYAPPPQQYAPPPQQYAPQYPPQGQFPAAPLQYAQPYPPPAVYASPYPPASSWTPAPAAYGYPAPAVAYAAPAVAYPPMPTYTTYPAYPSTLQTYAAPMMGIPMAPAMNYVFQLRGVHLDRKDIFSKSDPFLVFWASRHPGGYHAAHNIARRERKETKHNKKFGNLSGNWVMIHRTETLHNNQNPLWAPFTINLISLCGGNFDSVFKVEVWDCDVHTNHDFIGGAVTTMRDLQTSKEVRLINKRRIGIYNSSGRLEVVRCAPA